MFAHYAKPKPQEFTTNNWALVRDHHNVSSVLYKLAIGAGAFPRKDEVIRINGAWFKVVAVEWELHENSDGKEYLTPVIEVE